MADKSVTFRLDLETYARLIGHFPQPGAKGNMEALLDAFENQGVDNGSTAEVTRLQQELDRVNAELEKKQADYDRINANNIELDRKYMTLESSSTGNTERIAELTKTNEEQEQTISELRDQIKALTNQEITWEQMKPAFSPLTVLMLEETANRLSVLLNKPVTEINILADIFNRYTVERNSEWFYPFVLKKQDIVNIAHSINPNVVNFDQVLRAIVKK